jgi:formate dehydrogenase subunit gamma
MAKNHTLIDLKSGKADPAVAIAARYGNKPDALLEILHDVQHELGHVPEKSLPAIANALNLSRAEVYGVATFYHDFHLKPTGKHVLKLCGAEACQAMGGRALQAAVEKFLKIKVGETTADGLITLEATYCLGLCASSPTMMVNERPFARVDAKKAKAIIEGLRT